MDATVPSGTGGVLGGVQVPNVMGGVPGDVPSLAHCRSSLLVNIWPIISGTYIYNQQS